MKLDIDYFKSAACDDPYYLGLGCIRVKILNVPGRVETINFYSKKHTPAISKYIHTHPAVLHSEKLYGTYENIKYDWKISEEKTNWCMEELQSMQEVNRGSLKPKLLHPNVVVYEKEKEILNDSMIHSDFEFHDLNSITDVVITKMVHSGYLDTTPKVKILRNKSVYPDFVCALSKPGNAKDNWEIIREILNEIV